MTNFILSLIHGLIATALFVVIVVFVHNAVKIKVHISAKIAIVLSKPEPIIFHSDVTSSEMRQPFAVKIMHIHSHGDETFGSHNNETEVKREEDVEVQSSQLLQSCGATSLWTRQNPGKS